MIVDVCLSPISWLWLWWTWAKTLIEWGLKKQVRKTDSCRSLKEDTGVGQFPETLKDPDWHGLSFHRTQRLSALLSQLISCRIQQIKIQDAQWSLNFRSTTCLKQYLLLIWNVCMLCFSWYLYQLHCLFRDPLRQVSLSFPAKTHFNPSLRFYLFNDIDLSHGSFFLFNSVGKDKATYRWRCRRGGSIIWVMQTPGSFVNHVFVNRVFSTGANPNIRHCWLCERGNPGIT